MKLHSIALASPSLWLVIAVFLKSLPGVAAVGMPSLEGL